MILCIKEKHDEIEPVAPKEKQKKRLFKTPFKKKKKAHFASGVPVKMKKADKYRVEEHKKLDVFNEEKRDRESKVVEEQKNEFSSLDHIELPSMSKHNQMSMNSIYEALGANGKNSSLNDSKEHKNNLSIIYGQKRRRQDQGNEELREKKEDDSLKNYFHLKLNPKKSKKTPKIAERRDIDITDLIIERHKDEEE